MLKPVSNPIQQSQGSRAFFLENSSDWFWEVDLHLRFIYSNGQLERKLNLPTTFLLGKNSTELAQHSPDMLSCFGAIAQAFDNKKPPTNIEVTLSEKMPGAILTVSVAPCVEEGVVTGYRGIGVWQERERQTDRDSISPETLFAALETSPSSVFVTGIDGRIEYANPGFFDITGYSAEEIYGQTPRILNSGKTDKKVYIELWRTILAGESWKGTVQNKRKNGDLYWSEETVSPVIQGDGRITHFIAIQQDVTEKIRAERALRLSEARFKGYSDVASDWYWEMDAELVFTYFSDSATEFSGLTIEQMIGLKRKEIITLPEDREKWAQHHKNLMARRPFKDFEYTYIRPDGRRMNFQISGKPFFSRSGVFKGFRGVGRDITERKLLEEQLLQSQKMEVVGQLAGGLAHDFNNMLAVISGNAEMLNEKMVEVEKEGVPELSNILTAVQRGASLTSQILAFSRKQVLSPVSINLVSLLRDMNNILLSSLSGEVELKIETGEDLWPCFIDPQQTTNAILNACINARDAMTGKGRIMISTENITVESETAVTPVEPGDYVKLSIEDDGAGISPENLEKVFEPFFTTKETGQGTGLGLSMLFGFAKQSGGGVTIDSEPGAGTALTLYLPRQIAV